MRDWPRRAPACFVSPIFPRITAKRMCLLLVVLSRLLRSVLAELYALPADFLPDADKLPNDPVQVRSVYSSTSGSPYTVSQNLLRNYQHRRKHSALYRLIGRTELQTARSCSTIAHIRIFIDFTTIINIIDRVIGCKVQPFNRSQSEISMSSLINTH